MKPWSEGLALALIAGPFDLYEMIGRVQQALGANPPWVRPLCKHVLEHFALKPSEDELEQLAACIQNYEPVEAEDTLAPILVRRWFLPAPENTPVHGPPASFARTHWTTSGELARALQLSPAELDWFADLQHRNRVATPEALRHYRFVWVRKRSGGHRLLETPKPRIKALQRSILHEILAVIPPSAAAHGFVAGRSPLSFVAPHVGRPLVLRVDLEDFFSVIGIRRVRALFQRLGHGALVARKLAGLCCIETPPHVLRQHPGEDPSERYRTAQRLRVPHLPQGAPTSPALSNLIAFRLDRRLSGLARAQGLTYTRYADDLAFSGERRSRSSVDWLIAAIGAIALEEGFHVRFRKTRVMSQAGRQRLAGLVINQAANVPRTEYDRLRATLHNARVHGPASQNRAQHTDFRAHLQGRIAWVTGTHPARGERLRAMFERIEWSEA